jgi:hypothetical protein
VVMAKMPVQIRPSLRKKQKSKRERMESTDPEKDVWRKQWKERSGSDGFCRMDTGAGDKNLYRKWSSSTEHNR